MPDPDTGDTWNFRGVIGRGSGSQLPVECWVCVTEAPGVRQVSVTLVPVETVKEEESLPSPQLMTVRPIS